MNANQKYKSPHLAALAGSAAGGKPADALRALLGVGDLPHAECVPPVLDLAERAMGGQFGLSARLNRGAGELNRLVALAHRAKPNGLDRATLLAAHQTVGLVTGHLLSLAELVALTQGAGRPILDLYMVRYRLLSGSGPLDGRATPHVWQRLDRADQASRLVEWPTPVSVRHQDIATRDRQVDALPNINLRLGRQGGDGSRRPPAPSTTAQQVFR
ncbi:hypothetical protein GCM10010840_08730 [Deinococcus aerolatus]|uniref:Uncharacterized protein n=1 Tax=Deinococcus aerolatus TaxID=522487 RepID=A0ABQ2G3G5_9DEIO|nr:hypothetical protein [Deinococcus aerolatus]GGL72944.1 hypothetical protein GCM10010840_08730 [Deinococcus aerolatus]